MLKLHTDFKKKKFMRINFLTDFEELVGNYKLGRKKNLFYFVCNILSFIIIMNSILWPLNILVFMTKSKLENTTSLKLASLEKYLHVKKKYINLWENQFELIDIINIFINFIN